MSNRVKELEQRLARTEQQLRLFQKISRFMVREMSLQEVLKGIVSLVVEFMECDSCLLYLLDKDLIVRYSGSGEISLADLQTQILKLL